MYLLSVNMYNPSIAQDYLHLYTNTCKYYLNSRNAGIEKAQNYILIAALYEERVLIVTRKSRVFYLLNIMCHELFTLVKVICRAREAIIS